ncbi:hypothetical protein GRI38_10335 [Altererythrobacter aurantiacus]|uniref:Uncharacterized protein n=1 Tax=Parapontixanthobacter aurantiacus TaxID=1463599 RepID=A0A844ZGP9_9SPHN|nr:hypothetical protein [Parapontixanthobacter aurantiacus]MXO86422.1 hypothetical protein [Parapontixanthobacter aurantiacus]
MKLEPKLLWWIVAGYAALVLICLFWMGEPNQTGFFTVGGLFLLWALAPLVPFCLGTPNLPLKLLGLVLSALAGAGFYIMLTFLTQPDAFNLLIFVFVPFYQLAFSAIWLVGVWIWSRFFKERKA